MAWLESKSDPTLGGVQYLTRPNDIFKPGDKVLHGTFGNGVVTAIRISEGSKAACVKFELVGCKWIVPDEKYMKVIQI